MSTGRAPLHGGHRRAFPQRSAARRHQRVVRVGIATAERLLRLPSVEVLPGERQRKFQEVVPVLAAAPAAADDSVHDQQERMDFQEGEGGSAAGSRWGGHCGEQKYRRRAFSPIETHHHDPSTQTKLVDDSR